jgi:hypothetical protein
MTVAEVATTEPQPRANASATPLCPIANASGKEMAANATSVVIVAMTGSQTICLSCLKSAREARRTAFPVGFFCATNPPSDPTPMANGSRCTTITSRVHHVTGLGRIRQIHSDGTSAMT